MSKGGGMNICLRDESPNHFKVLTNKFSDIEFLEKLVNISSQSKDKDGVERVQFLMGQKFEDLGFEVSYIQNPLGISAPLVIAEKLGETSDFVTFITHSDTVTTPDKVEFKVDYENNRVYGAGVADDKAGLVMTYSVMKEFIKKNHHLSLRVVISPSEELGSIGFHQIFKEVGENSRYLFGMEPAQSDGTIISSRNGNRWYQIHVKGIAAHAGRFGESHLNATHEMARIISSLSHLNNDSEKIRINFSSLKSNFDSYNTICGGVQAKIDMRFDCFNKRNFLHESFLKVLSHSEVKCSITNQEARIFYSIEDDCPPLPAQKKGGLEEIILKNIAAHSEKTCAIHSGGAADINYFANKDNQGLDGLSAIGGKLHTKDEYIILSSYYERRESLLSSLKELDTNVVL